MSRSTPRRQPSGRRRFLLTIGALFMLLGYSYLPESSAAPAAEATSFATDPVPLAVYGAAFLLAGLTGVLGAARKALEPVGFVALQVASTLWGLAYIGSWLLNGYPRGWVTGAVFLTFSSAIAAVAGMKDAR